MEKFEIGIEHLEAIGEITANKLSDGIHPKFVVGAMDTLLGNKQGVDALSISYQKCGLDKLCSMNLASYLMEKEIKTVKKSSDN